MHTRPPAAPARTPDTLVALSAGPESDWKMSPWSSPEPANWGGSPSSFLGPPFSCPRLIGGPTSVGRDLSAHRRHMAAQTIGDGRRTASLGPDPERSLPGQPA